MFIRSQIAIYYMYIGCVCRISNIISAAILCGHEVCETNDLSLNSSVVITISHQNIVNKVCKCVIEFYLNQTWSSLKCEL